MDDADRAADLIEAEIEHARRLHAARVAFAPIESADLCAECGEQISSARQIAVPGCQLCADCATDLERRAALHRGAP